ncbi:MAG TPA: peptidase S10, partial [Caldimonas sp.]
MTRAGLLVVTVVLALAGCGGGGGDPAPIVSAPALAGALRDTTPYSTAAGASLAAPAETASITPHSIAVGAATLAYTATAGHLNAKD